MSEPLEERKLRVIGYSVLYGPIYSKEESAVSERISGHSALYGPIFRQGSKEARTDLTM